jgi:hypothetical protein
MTEPRRLLSDPEGGLASELLRAGVEEEPSPHAVERTVAGLGAGAATLGIVNTAASAPAVVGAAATTTLGAAGAMKLLAIGAAVGVASGGALFGVARVVERAERPPTFQAPHVSAPLPPNPVVSAPPVVAEVPPSLADPAVTEVPAARPKAPSAHSGSSPLAAEVALVDRAHASLRRGDARGALGLLASYEAAFESPRLLPEVFALRMEASESAGDDQAARRWASRLVSRYPRSAQAARARALLAGPAAEH